MVECQCKGTGLSSTGKKCGGCMGKGEKGMHVHLHGLLLCGKLLLRNLWIEWHLIHGSRTPEAV